MSPTARYSVKPSPEGGWDVVDRHRGITRHYKTWNRAIARLNARTAIRPTRETV